MKQDNNGTLSKAKIWWDKLSIDDKILLTQKHFIGIPLHTLMDKSIEAMYIYENPQPTGTGNTVSSERFFTDGEKWLQKDQNIFSIRKDGEVLGYIESKNGYLVTTGSIGENNYESFVDLIKGLQGFDICIDNFYW